MAAGGDRIVDDATDNWFNPGAAVGTDGCAAGGGGFVVGDDGCVAAGGGGLSATTGGGFATCADGCAATGSGGGFSSTVCSGLVACGGGFDATADADCFDDGFGDDSSAVDEVSLVGERLIPSDGSLATAAAGGRTTRSTSMSLSSSLSSPLSSSLSSIQMTVGCALGLLSKHSSAELWCCCCCWDTSVFVIACVVAVAVAFVLGE